MRLSSHLFALAIAASVLSATAIMPAQARAAEPVDVAARAKKLFQRDNLVAWCIVPFDAKKRGPEERAAMMEKLGLKHFAYDWRGEHVPSPAHVSRISAGVGARPQRYAATRVRMQRTCLCCHMHLMHMPKYD